MDTGRFEQAVESLSGKLREELRDVPPGAKRTAQEIRLRVGAPITLTCPGQIWFVGKAGELHNLPQPDCYIVTGNDLEDSVVTMSSYSVQAHQNEMRNGFLSLRGGHRAGLCGTAVVSGGEVAVVRDVTSINLRIAREVRGAADLLIDAVFRQKLCGVLVVGAPSSGKTTVLRDLARQLSSGKAGRFYSVAVVDERCELAAVYEGVPQNSLGPCCDVLSGYPKGEGILMAVRTLSPQAIICDEIGAGAEVDSILDGLNCGVRVIASAHADNVGELLRRAQIRRLLEHNAFERIVMLEGGEKPGRIRDILEVGEMIGQAAGDSAHRAMLIDDGHIHGVRVVGTGGGY